MEKQDFQYGNLSRENTIQVGAHLHMTDERSHIFQKGGLTLAVGFTPLPSVESVPLTGICCKFADQVRGKMTLSVIIWTLIREKKSGCKLLPWRGFAFYKKPAIG